MFSGSYFKIGSVLDKTPIRKVVAPFLLYKFAFDQNLSTVKNLRDKWFGKSAKSENITETLLAEQKSKFRSILIKIREELEKSPNMKVESWTFPYNFCIHIFLTIVQSLGNIGQ